MKYLISLGVLTTLIHSVATAADSRPNVVVVLTDDQGWGDLSINGNANLATPHVDSLARDGARFDRFYVCPVCSPTRAEFLTGRYHPRGGVFSTSTGGERLDLDEKTIGDTFQAAGYATAAFGKWHNGMQAPYHPNSCGFNEYYGFCSGHWGHYFDAPNLEHNGKLTTGKGFIIDDFTNHALEFIEQHKDEPFFCYLPFNTPHSPMQVPDRFYKKFANAEIEQRHHERKREVESLPMTRAALAMCENIDWNVGRVLKKLEELKLADNTIVVYFCDNGPNSYRWNGGMKGRKGSTDEGGVRSPLHIRWPAKIKPETRIPQIAAAIDLLPTLADLAGVRMTSEKPLDGRSLKPLLMQDGTEWPERTIFSHWRGRVSARTQRFRLDHTGGLFDINADPMQFKRVNQQHPKVAAELSQAVEKWKQELLPGLGKGDRPFTVGYAKVTHLPARDGRPHGNVKRSARAPNCSFFTNWSATDDRITWDIEVKEAGEFEATLHYTCAAEDVGATIELAGKNGRARAKIEQAHTAPLRGEREDHVDRGSESYVKEFRPMSLGTISLPAGRMELALKAIEIPGKRVADVRYLILTRKP